MVAPNPANGSANVVVSTVVDDRPSGGSAIDAAELWVDAVGPAGSGTAMSVAPGGGPMATATGSVTTDALAGLPEGVHSVSVRGRDAAGNWGPLSSGALVIDRSGPSIADGRGSPDPTQGGPSIAIQAVATDPAASTIVAAEWFSGPDPGPGLGTAMGPVDGAFDASVESVASSLGAGSTFGERVISVRAQDAAGNWGLARLVSYLITPADGIFADGFESGSLARWSSTTGSSRLAVRTSAAAGGRLGLTASLRGSLPAFVSDASPVSEASYHARFTLDAHRTSTRARTIRLFAGRDHHGSTIFMLEYRRGSSGSAWIRAGALRRGGTAYTAWTRFGSGVHTVELAWTSARAGRIGLWIDGVARASRSRLDTRAYRLESVRLGPSAGLVPGLRGSFSFDRFVSDRSSWIGR